MEVLLEDSKSDQRNMEESFSFFNHLVIQHSVERPPKSVGIFSPEIVSDIFDFSMTRLSFTNPANYLLFFLIFYSYFMHYSYFRQFKLYKYVFCPKSLVYLRQVLPNEVLEVKAVPSLDLASQRELKGTANKD